MALLLLDRHDVLESIRQSNSLHDAFLRVAKLPAAGGYAADVPSALWTDKPISGTEFMTHNQGQSGFEIHFRTDDKAKYEAVQDECRRQIDHAKPAADVRPVVLCKDCRHRDPEDHKCDCGQLERAGCVFPVDDNYWCAHGER